MNAMAIMFLVLGAIIAFPLAIVAIIYLVVPIFKAIGFVFKQVFGFIGSTIADVFRFIGAIITSVVLCFLVLGNIVVGRWSASAHFGRAVQSEISTASHCIYRLIIGNPARALCLTSLTEGLEKRIPQVVAAAPGADQPKGGAGGRLNQFDGYKIIGSLAGGGSGGRLYIAEPDNRKRAIFAKDGQQSVEQVVIKTFSLKEGSTLPQIVRENRALDAAKRLGLILEHELTPERFHYTMRYVPGENLSLVTQRLHAAAGPAGLDRKHLADVLGYMGDLMATLRTYHEGGLWHKDVKPDNIIVADGAAHLVDFGLVTPLRSAMTLTTHGTEYFRDPEMVRMALRGVKVHEVDGAKFDVYAAGAVLFSMIENSFPAHGGLSQLSKKCPEALRWIVRRAMTDYEKRYPTARAMFNDLAVVAGAADPFSVKLAELPSVVGSDADVEMPAAPQPEPFVFAAGFPPAEVRAAAAEVRAAAGNVRHAQDLPGARGRMRDFFAGVGGKIDDAMAKAGFAPGTPGVPPVPPIPVPPNMRTRPNLRIKSWWRGNYDVIDSNVFSEPHMRGQVAFTPAAFGGPAFGGPAPRPRAVPSGIPAAEQLRRARERADAARSRVATRLGRGPVNGRSHASGFNPGVAAALFLFLAACVAMVAGVFFFAVRQQNIVVVTGPDMPATPTPPASPEVMAFAAEFTNAFSALGDGFGEHFTEAIAGFDPADRLVPLSSVVPTAPHTLFVLREPFSLEAPARDEVTKVLTRLNALGMEVVGTVDPALTDEPAASSDALSAQLRAKIALAPPTSDEARVAVETWLQGNPRFDAVLWAVRGDDGDLSWRVVPNMANLGRADATPPVPPAPGATSPHKIFGVPGR